MEGEWEWGGGEEGRSGAEKLCMIALLFSSVGESTGVDTPLLLALNESTRLKRALR